MRLRRPVSLPLAISPCLLLGGQSNADGRDGVPAAALTGRLVIVGTGRGDWGANASVDELANEIPVVKVAYGGKSVPDWLDIHQPEMFGDVALHGFTPTELVWIQGERDAREDALADAFYDNFNILIDRFIAEYPTLEVAHVALLSAGHDPATFTRKATINAAYVATAAARTELRWHLIDTDGLTLQGGLTHYVRASYDSMRATISAWRAADLPLWVDWLAATPKALARLTAGEAASMPLSTLVGQSFRRRDALDLRRAVLATAGTAGVSVRADLQAYARTTPTDVGESAFQWFGTSNRQRYPWDAP